MRAGSVVSNSNRLLAARHGPYLLLIYVTRLIAALVISYPFCSLTAAVLGAWPRGDAMIFEPGGLMLLETLRLHQASWGPLLEQSVMIAALVIPVGVVTSTAFLVSVCMTTKPTASAVVARTFEHLKATIVAFLAYGVILGCIGALFAVISVGAAEVVRSPFGDPAADLTQIAVLVVGLLLLAACGIVLDLVRATIVRERLDFVSALRPAVSCATRHTLTIICAYWSRGAAFLFLALAELNIVGWLGESSPWNAWTIAVLHQALLIAFVVLRASWLVRIVGLIARLPGPSAQSPGRL